jgi:hypothetical protein
MRLMRKAGRAGFATAAVLALAIPGALIGQIAANAVPSGVSIAYSANAFHGSVESPSARCERHRTVSIFKVRPGDDSLVGRDETNRRGRYRVPEQGANGRFYAKVARKVVGGYNNTVVCQSARSGTIRV